MVIGAPLPDLITIEAANIWGKLFSAEGFLYCFCVDHKVDESENMFNGNILNIY